MQIVLQRGVALVVVGAQGPIEMGRVAAGQQLLREADGILERRVRSLAGERQQRMGGITCQHQVAPRQPGWRVDIERLPEVGKRGMGSFDRFTHERRKAAQMGVEEGADGAWLRGRETVAVELHKPDHTPFGQSHQPDRKPTTGVEHLDKAMAQGGRHTWQVDTSDNLVDPGAARCHSGAIGGEDGAAAGVDPISADEHISSARWRTSDS